MRDRLLEWVRRKGAAPRDGATLTRLVDGAALDAVASERGLPRAEARAMATYYDQIEPMTRVCDGTPCHFAGARSLRASLAARGPLGEVRCLGHCYEGPAHREGDAVWCRGVRDGSVPRRTLADTPIVLRHLVPGASVDIAGE
jgi:hypothetical protein